MPPNLYCLCLHSIFEGNSQPMSWRRATRQCTSLSCTGVMQEPAPAALRAAFLLFTSAMSGVFAAMVLVPAQRLATCMASTLNPPASLVASSLLEWRTVPLQPPAWKVALLFCTEALPALSLLLWVNCFSEGLLGLSSDQRAMVQGVALLLTGALLESPHPRTL